MNLVFSVSDLNLTSKYLNEIKSKCIPQYVNSVKILTELSEECKDELKEILIKYPQFKNEKQILKFVVRDFKLKYCLHCGKLMSFDKRNAIYCNRKCTANSQITKDKLKKVMLEKYGVSTNLHIKETREKALRNAASNLSKEKRKQTCLRKYGVDVSSKNKDVYKKMLITKAKLGYSRYW